MQRDYWQKDWKYKHERASYIMDNSIEMLLQLAEQGITSAQTTLGVKYYRGDGIEKNYKEAVKWLTMAAFKWSRMQYNGAQWVHCENVVHEWTRYEDNANGFCTYKFDGKEWLLSECNTDDDADFYEYAGDSTAAEWLSECYLCGNGVDKNLDRAIGLREFCAELVLIGHATGDCLLLELAEFYAESAEPNYTKALRWWAAAADKGFPKAEYYLAYYYYKGIGTSKDEKRALECLKGSLNERFINNWCGLGSLLPGEEEWYVKMCKLAVKLGYDEANNILSEELD